MEFSAPVTIHRVTAGGQLRAVVVDQRILCSAACRATPPDLNPIWQAFARRTAHLRRNSARTFTELFQAIGSVCGLHDPIECRTCLWAGQGMLQKTGPVKRAVTVLV